MSFSAGAQLLDSYGSSKTNDGTMVVPAGSSVPPGWVIVGSDGRGNLIVAPSNAAIVATPQPEPQKANPIGQGVQTYQQYRGMENLGSDIANSPIFSSTSTPAATASVPAANSTSGLMTSASAAGATGATEAGGMTATESALGIGAGEAASTAGSTTVSVPAGAAVPEGYTAVGTAADGGTMAAPSSTASAGGSTPVASVGSVSYLGAAMAAKDLYDAYNTWNASGVDPRKRAVRVEQQAALAAADLWTAGMASTAEGFLRQNKTTGRWLGELDKLAAKMPQSKLIAKMISGKDVDQFGRDQVRKQLKTAGFINDAYKLDLTGGNAFDIGAEKMADQSKVYNINFNTGDAEKDATTAKVVSYLDPLSSVIAQGDAKKTSDLTGMFTNAALSSGNPYQHVADMFRRAEGTMGLTPSEMRGQLDSLFEAKKIDEGRKDVLLASLDRVIQGSQNQPQQQKKKK